MELNELAEQSVRGTDGSRRRNRKRATAAQKAKQKIEKGDAVQAATYQAFSSNGEFQIISDALLSVQIGFQPGRTNMKRWFFILITLVAVTMPLHAKECCHVSAIDARTGIATAKETATGRTFQFKLSDASLLRQLRPGSPVYANFRTKQVSLDGKTPCGEIISISAAADMRAPEATTPTAKEAAQVSAPPKAMAPANSTGSQPNTSSAGSGTATPKSSATPLPLRPSATLLQVKPLGSGSSGSSGIGAPQVVSCGGTTNPLTEDNCSKAQANPTILGFTATCGASITITGNTFPAGSSDWLQFVVPASHMTCKTPSNGTPYVSVYMSSSGGILFDVYESMVGNAAPCGDGNCAGGGGRAVGVTNYAGLGTGTTGLPPGYYFIRIYGMTPSTVGTWTLRISS